MKYKKGIALILVMVFVFSCFSYCFANTEDTVKREVYVDEQVLTELESNGETYAVIWLKDIDKKELLKRVEENTGLNESNLAVADENFDFETVKKLLAISDGNENVNVKSDIEKYLAETEPERAEEKARTDLYIREKRKIGKAMCTAKVLSVVNDIKLNDENMVYQGTYAPVIIAKITTKDLEKMKCCENVASIEFISEEELFAAPVTEQSLSESMDTTGITKLHTDTGLSGKGVKIGIYEPGVPRVNSELPGNRLVVLQDESEIPTQTEHATLVSSIMAGKSGIAYNAIVYANETHWTKDNYLKPDIDEFLNYDIKLINMSAGASRTIEYTQEEKLLDYLIDNYCITFVKSAGNESAQMISSPGLAKNVITVGAYNNMGTSDHSDDKMADFSSYKAEDGCAKPDVVAQGYIDNSRGTSLAAPFVTGTIALMLELRPSLAAYPYAIKAIIMASAQYKAKPAASNIVQEQMTSGLTDQQGAGVFDPYLAIAITGQGSYAIGSMARYEASKTVRFTRSFYGAAGMNIVLAWSTPGYKTAGGYDTYPENLGLTVYANDRFIRTSNLTNSSAEMVYVKQERDDSRYRLVISNRMESDELIPYAYAWCTNKEHFIDRKDWEGIYYLKDAYSGKYLKSNGSEAPLTPADLSYTDDLLWIIKQNKDNSSYQIRSGFGNYGYLSANSDFISINHEHYYANNAGNGAKPIFLKENEDKTCSISMRIAARLWGLTGYEPDAADWQDYYDGSNRQSWYLEKCDLVAGDVDLDNLITATDSSYILKVASKTVEPTNKEIYLCDVNADGVINAEDASIVLKIAAHLL